MLTPWTVTWKAPLSRQEYLSGLPFPPPGDLPNLGVKAESLIPPALAGGSFTSSAIWEPMHQQICCLILVKHKKRYKIIFKNHQIYLWGLSDYPWDSWITKRFWIETFSFSHATPHFSKQNFQELWKPPAILSYWILTQRGFSLVSCRSSLATLWIVENFIVAELPECSFCASVHIYPCLTSLMNSWKLRH